MGARDAQDERKHKGSTDHANGPVAEAVIRSIYLGLCRVEAKSPGSSSFSDSQGTSSLQLAWALVPGSAPCPSNQIPVISLVPWDHLYLPIPPRYPHPEAAATGTHRSSGAETAGGAAAFPNLQCPCLPLQLAKWTWPRSGCRLDRETSYCLFLRWPGYSSLFGSLGCWRV